MTDLSVKFSPPPSANKLWRPVAKDGRAFLVSTPAYTSWINVAMWEIRQAMGTRQTLKGDCAVSLKIPRRSKLSDLDNRVKPCFDALQKGGAIENDRQIIRYCVSWSSPDDEYVVAEVFGVQA